jgi:hypothetical protein
MRSDMRRTMSRLGERFATLVIDGMADGSLRIVDPSVAAQVINGMINAVAEIERWVPGIDAGNAFELYARPLFTGLLSAGEAASARPCPPPPAPLLLPVPDAPAPRHDLGPCPAPAPLIDNPAAPSVPLPDFFDLPGLIAAMRANARSRQPRSVATTAWTTPR